MAGLLRLPSLRSESLQQVANPRNPPRTSLLDFGHLLFPSQLLEALRQELAAFLEIRGLQVVDDAQAH